MADTELTISIEDNDAHVIWDADRGCVEFWLAVKTGGADMKVNVEGFHAADTYHIVRAGAEFTFKAHRITKVTVKRMAATNTTVDFGPKSMIE